MQPEPEQSYSPDSDEFDPKLNVLGGGATTEDDTSYSSPPSAESSGLSSRPSSPELHITSENPDIRRLRRDHSQQGYVDGITQGKPASVQPAFDNGYPLGAEFGLQIGRLLGLLQGIRGKVCGMEELQREAESLEERVRDELLDVQIVFGGEYWKVDEHTGDILPRWTELSNTDETSRTELVRTHPLIQQWQKAIQSLHDLVF
ncbi:hypothetical protein V1512DRAFT_264838 [Lipomyces arxii]|uniref:uncharacterized protein n=1 Tax=Lipomyces arxii TaxID=56418 RepID=UPI0034CF058D